MSLTNALSIDVEDYFQVSGFESRVSRNSWERIPSRVVENTRRILRILQKHEVTATFFVLGWVAERFPALVREIDDAGHEIGSHGYWHHLIYRQTPDEFREDLRRSLRVLEDQTGRPVRSYRAPSFSITRQSLWALEIMAEEGIRCDSSIFPTRHDRYGIPDANPEIHTIATPAGDIVEFPISVVRWRGLSLPASGGGYFRLYPYRVTRKLVSLVNRSGRPLMFYMHPWELDPRQPVIRNVRRMARFRHRVNLAATETRLERMLSEFRFSSMAKVLESRGFAFASAATCPGLEHV